MSTFEERLVALEALAATNQIPATLAGLLRKLEATWQPDANVLLGDGSITPPMLTSVIDSDAHGISLGDTRIRWGTGTMPWANGTKDSTQPATFTHGLGKTPTFCAIFNKEAVGYTSIAAFTTDTLTTTTFRGFGVLPAVAVGATVLDVYWMAIA